jgi:cell wall-associated NlpC family hydrolase
MPQTLLTNPRIASLAVLTLSATLSAALFPMGGGDAHARSSKNSRRSKSSSSRKSSRFTPRPVGVWAWTAGSRTYIRARPSIETPPVAKVPRHTRVMVWGKYDGWYRVETADGKFGWVRTGLVSSPKIAKVKPLSHTKAKRASNRTANQVMYGNADDLKKHYRLYGSSGAKKGLAKLGVAVGRKANSRAKSQRIAYYKSYKSAPKTASQKFYSQKAAQYKVAQRKAAQQKAAQARANQTRWAALRAGEIKASRAKAAQAKAAQFRVAKASQARYAAFKAAQIKAAQTRAAKARLARQKEAQRMAQERAAKARQARQAQQASDKQASEQATSVKTPSGTSLQPTLPSPTAVAPKVAPKKAERLTPAIPLPPQAPRGAGKGNFRLPRITPEDLIRARDEHLKRSSRAPQSEPKSENSSPESSKVAALPPLFGVYYTTSAVYAPSLASGKDQAHGRSSFMRGSLPSAPLTSRVEVQGPKPLTAPSAKSLTASKTGKVVVAKTTSKAAKPSVKQRVAANPKANANAGPHRGGSPRDLARLAQASFGQGVANQALSYRGRPYIRGAASPSRGFDCSGLIYYLLRQRGYNPPRTAAGLARYGTPVPPGQLKAGDLVLFANTYKRGVSHVGIYMGNNNFVHAATSGTGVRVDSLGSAYYCRKYYGARRVEAKR